MADGAGAGRIDVHHFFPPEYFAAMGGMMERPPVRGWTLDRTLEELDRNGVDTAMLSLSPPGIHHATEAENRALARTVNEHAAALLALFDHVPVSRVPLGTDFPFGSTAETIRGLEACGLGVDDVQRVCRGNAGRLIPRFAVRPARARPSIGDIVRPSASEAVRLQAEGDCQPATGRGSGSAKPVSV